MAGPRLIVDLELGPGGKSRLRVSRTTHLNKLRRSVSRSGCDSRTFVLQLNAGPHGCLRARVLKSPFGEAAAEASLPSPARCRGAIQCSRDQSRLLAPKAMRRLQDLDLPGDLGNRALLFGLSRSGPYAPREEPRPTRKSRRTSGLRLKIKIDPNGDDAGSLGDLPLGAPLPR